MRTRFVVAAGLFVGSAAGFAGCDGPAGTGTGTGGTRPDPEKKGVDINIRGPKGGSVDVETKGDGRTKVDVDRPGGTGKN
ncbi:MAG: hypothetical protein K2X82_02825 [Gemmataceae bacterium]|nr:hypothetical protein [Gemmataceae bacterium]